MKKDDDNKHVSTKTVKEMLKLSDCSVMHLRTSGKVRFSRKGNSYLYLLEDVEKLVGIGIKNQ